MGEGRGVEFHKVTDLFNLMVFLMGRVSRRFEKSSLIKELRSPLIIECE
jgi:hypothetical protein